jgi:hypothetical protein
VIASSGGVLWLDRAAPKATGRRGWRWDGLGGSGKSPNPPERWRTAAQRTSSYQAQLGSAPALHMKRATPHSRAWGSYRYSKLWNL